MKLCSELYLWYIHRVCHDALSEPQFIFTIDCKSLVLLGNVVDDMQMPGASNPCFQHCVDLDVLAVRQYKVL